MTIRPRPRRARGARRAARTAAWWLSILLLGGALILVTTPAGAKSGRGGGGHSGGGHGGGGHSGGGRSSTHSSGHSSSGHSSSQRGRASGHFKGSSSSGRSSSRSSRSGSGSSRQRSSSHFDYSGREHSSRDSSGGQQSSGRDGGSSQGGGSGTKHHLGGSGHHKGGHHFYRPYFYWWPIHWYGFAWSVYYDPFFYPYYRRVVVENAALTDVPQDEYDQFTSEAVAWGLLAEGRPIEAQRIFSQLAQDFEEHVVPKVGYSLSSAGLGNLDRGVWAMRRALRTGASDIGYTPIDPRMRERIRALIEEYRTTPEYAESDVDHLFMMAALHYLLGETDAARDAIERAIERGDTSESTVNLGALLDAGTTQPIKAEPAKPDPREIESQPEEPAPRIGA